MRKYQNSASIFNKSTLLFIALIWILSFFSSCFDADQEISWDLNTHAPLLIVDGAVSNQLKNQGIRLALSNPYFSSEEPVPVHGAVVRISDGTTTYHFSENSANQGIYYSDIPFAGITGKTYDLFITLSEAINGQKEYSSSATMPVGLDLDSIQCEIHELSQTDNKEDSKKEKDTTILYVVYFGQEPVSTGNYYLAKIFRNDKPMFSSIRDNPRGNDKDRNGQYINVMFAEKNVAKNDTITFNLYSITDDYNEYLEAISNLEQTENIYSQQGPPANAVGNIKGALGFFVTAYVSSKKAIAIDMRE